MASSAQNIHCSAMAAQINTHQHNIITTTMASSAQNIHCSAMVAPPPTPSTQSNNVLSSSSAAASDALSRLLHRLPPVLSLPSLRLASPPSTCPPLISFSDNIILDDLLSSSSQLGFFQLTDHSVPSQLASSAESEALTILTFPKNRRNRFSRITGLWDMKEKTTRKETGSASRSVWTQRVQPSRPS